MLTVNRLLNFSLDLQEKAENSSISVLKMMGSKNVCTLEFACILGRNIKCSIIIIIIIVVTKNACLDILFKKKLLNFFRNIFLVERKSIFKI